MLITKLVKLFIFLLCCDSCTSLKVPIVWSDTFKDLSEESVESATVKGNKRLISFNQNDRMDLPAPSSIQHPPIVQQGSTFYETFHPQPYQRDYFTYPATKPPFAVNIARYHGVTNPHKLFHSYPIVPKPAKGNPPLGQRLIIDNVLAPFQKYVKSNSHSRPISNNYEVFHPYKSETPHLQALYRDPVLSKVRKDVEDNKNRLQKYEKDAGKANIKKSEYLESPKETEKKLFPKESHKSTFEDHRPEKTKVFYEKPSNHDVKSRHNALNKKIKYPIENMPTKVKPADYNPLRERLNVFKDKQHMTFGDNEYPQKNSEEYNEDPEPEGYDIYLHEKEKYKKFRDGLDEDINEALHHDEEPAPKSIELSDEKENLQKGEDVEDSEEDFVPIKMYAQVRKSETVKHLPKKAAFEEAVTFDDFLNAPRLKEAVKSTKAQTVYSEEGYEDSAYDHAGEQQHAENDESHEGFLKQKEHSNGGYRTPTESTEYNYENGRLHGKDFGHESKYLDDVDVSNERDDYEEASAETIEDYSDNGEAESNSETGSTDNEYFENDNQGRKVILYPKNVKVFSNDLQKHSNKNKDQRSHTILSKRTLDLEPKASPSISSKRHKVKNNKNKKNKEFRSHRSQLKQGISHEIPSHNQQFNLATHQNPQNKQYLKRKKRDTPQFEVPSFSIEGTYLDEKEIEKLAKSKLQKLRRKKSNKYPYYFSKSMPNKFSPLKYAEDMKSIPKKTLGGTEFYDSRTSIDCESIDPEVYIPVKDKNGKVINEDNSHLDDSQNKESLKHKRETEPNEQKHSPKLGGLGDKIDCLKTKYFGDNPLDSPFFSESIVKPLHKKADKSYVSFYDTLEVPSDLLTTVETLNSGTEKVSDILSTKFANGPIPHDTNNNTDVLTDVLNHIKMDLSTNVDPTHNQIVLMFLTNNTDDAKDKLFKSFTQKDKVVVDSPHVRSRRHAELINSNFGKKDFKNIKFGQTRKRNAHHKEHNEPSKLEEDSQKDEKGMKSVVEILDVSNDKRRGEPQYEVTYENHRMDSKNIESEPTIKNHFKLDSVKKKTSNFEIETTTQSLPTSKTRPFDSVTIIPKTSRGNKKFDDMVIDSKISSVVKSDPENFELTKTNSPLRKRLHTTTTTTSTSAPLEEEYEEYEDYEDEEDLPNHEEKKDRINLDKNDNFEEINLSDSKDSKLPEKFTNKEESILKSSTLKHDKGVVPKIEERSIQNKKTTLITDSKSYGNGDEINGDIEGKINRETVEKLVGGKNTADYLPEYERQIQQSLDKLQVENQTKGIKQNGNKKKEEIEEDDIYSEDEYEDDDDYYYDDEEVEVTSEKSPNIRKDEKNLNIQTSTTTLGPVLINASTTVNTENDDKKNITLATLEMYKDNNLAKNINKLMDKEGDQFPLHTDVEVFKENFRIDQEPKHGGNYKSEKIVRANDQDTVETGVRLQNTETNRQSAKLLELQSDVHGKSETKPKHLHGGNLKSIHENRQGKLPSRGRTMAKIIELRESEAPESTLLPKMMHGGNLRAVHENNQRPSRRKLSSKIIERNEDVTTVSSLSTKDMHGGNLRRRPQSRSSENKKQSDNSASLFKTGNSMITLKSEPRAMHQIRKKTDDPNNRKVTEPLIHSASLTLTSTPSYILDPSKRKYFYVDE